MALVRCGIMVSGALPGAATAPIPSSPPTEAAVSGMAQNPQYLSEKKWRRHSAMQVRRATVPGRHRGALGGDNPGGGHRHEGEGGRV